MATLGLVLVFAFIAGISGQPNPLPTIIYYDVGTDIYTRDSGGSPSPLNLGTSDDRKSCFDGTDFYYTEGNSIFKSPDPTPIYTAPAGRILASIACRCNLLAVGLTDSDSNTFVKIITTNPVEVVVKLSFEVEGRASIGFSTEGTCYFIVCTILQTRIYDCNNLTGDPMHMTEINLGRQPRCIACHQVDSEVYIFVTFDTQTSVLRLHWDVLAGTPLEATAISVLTEGTFSDVAARVSCVAIADGYVYFLIDELISSDDTQYELSRYPIEPWLLDVPTNLRDDIQVLETGSDGNIDGDANGLSVCGSACQADCDPGACDCSADCGFCFDDAGGGECQCENSATPNCCYDDLELAGQCLDPTPRIDACCLVKNPLALRRSGGDVCVVGVTTEEGTIDVGRAARTGRWLKLPIHTEKSNTATPPYYGGFSAAVPPQSRGRRFGVYRADFVPDDSELMKESIPCIATENSGFVNILYTYTISQNTSVYLGAEFLENRLVRFQQTLRWRRTTIGGSPVPVPSCALSLVCHVSGSGLSDSIYEVYRPGREKRTWHPLFYLFVRSCDDGLFGADCALTCGTCVNGVCDDVNGLCNCYPGFTGDTCEDVCPEGRIGKDCSFECSDVFPGSDCSNILICNPGKVGCKCYPGLQAPDCIKPCEAGYWGSHCQSTCTAPCDPRTGL